MSKKKAVVIKTSKPGQDLRFDVPSVGAETVRTMVESGCSALAVEAGKTLIFDEPEMVSLADAHGIVIVAVQSKD